MLLVGLGGGLAGVAAVLFGYWDWPAPSRRLMSSGPFVLWTFLIATQTLLWTLAVPVAVRVAWSRRSFFKDARAEVLISTAVFAVVLIATAVASNQLVHQPPYIPESILRLGVILGFGGMAAAAAGWGMWLSRHASLKLGEQGDVGALDQFADLRRDVERLLGILAAVVAVALLATAAQRRVVLWFTEHLTPGERNELSEHLPFEYPPELVIVYGLVFSIVLALAALPTLMTLQSVGRTLLNETDGSAEQRKELAALYGLEIAPAAAFRATLAILAPLLGSLTSLVPEIGQ